MVPLCLMQVWVIFGNIVSSLCNLFNKLLIIRLFSAFCSPSKAGVTLCIRMILPTLGKDRCQEELLLQRIPFIFVIFKVISRPPFNELEQPDFPPARIGTLPQLVSLLQGH